MEKIKLKPWQRTLVYSILGLLVLLIVLNIFLNREDDLKRLPVAVEMNLDLQPSDSTSRLFYDELTKGDSIRFETIKGQEIGWIFQVFSVGKTADYDLWIDFRQSDHLWKKGDSLIFTNQMPGMKSNCPIGLLQFGIESKVLIGTNEFFTDKLDFSKYYLSLNCRRYDSLASFDGVFYAEEYLENPEFSPEKLVLTGSFRADSIEIGHRVVN